MPTYPSNYNDPTLTVNNLTDLRQLTNPLAAGNAGDPDLTTPTATYDDLATALNLLLVEIYQIKSQVIGTYDISNPVGSVTTNSNITSGEQTFVAQAFQPKVLFLTKRALQLAREIQNLQADINTAVGASGSQSPAASGPSEYNHGW
ncbi:MAG: hypothetical protein JSS66_04665 [Armatimonadetes bacterium]|nr:hypothetical protein [Armatimonadota bacterium]